MLSMECAHSLDLLGNQLVLQYTNMSFLNFLRSALVIKYLHSISYASLVCLNDEVFSHVVF